jgi:hypothetical protein
VPWGSRSNRIPLSAAFKQQRALGDKGLADRIGFRLDHRRIQSDTAERCIGLLPPPSRNDPVLETASITARGPTIQVQRQPG